MSEQSWQRRLDEMSLALRISASGAAFGLVVASAAAVLGYVALSRQLDARAGAELAGKRDLLVHVLSELPAVELIADNGHRFADLLIGHDDLHLAVVDPRDGRVLVNFSRSGAESVSRLGQGEPLEMLRWQGPDSKHYASLTGSSRVGDGTPVRYVITLDLMSDRSMQRGYIAATLLGLPVILVLVAGGAWAVTRTGLAPLQQFTRLASSVTMRNLGGRIGLQRLPTELTELAVQFNAMLDRIDTSFKRLSEFSSDLAHEMRTPVSTLLGRTQVALSRDRTNEELRDVLAGNVEELDRLTRLIADMLFLARADHGEAVLEHREVNLADEARRVAEYLGIEAEERGVSVEVDGVAVVQGDRLLVQRAFTNLLSNAIRHSEASGKVRVGIRRTPDHVIVEVANRGREIPAALIGQVFERFARLDEARARTDGGAGLGLAIVRSIMHSHGGSAQVASGAGTTTFSLHFPAS